MTFYLRFEANGIQRFVLSGRELAEMLGASALVSEVTRAERAVTPDGEAQDARPGLSFLSAFLREIVGGGEVVYEAAGGATLRLDDEDQLRRFVARFPVELSAFAPGLEVSLAWTEADGEQPLGVLAERLALARNFQASSGPFQNPVLEATSTAGGTPARAQGGAGRGAAAGGRRRGGSEGEEPLDGGGHFVRADCAAFEDATRNEKSIDGTMTASGGVAFVRRRHPFRMVYGLREALANVAKRAGRQASEQGGCAGSMVMFDRITASVAGDEGEDLRFRMGPFRAGAIGTGLALDAIRKLAARLRDPRIPWGRFRELLDEFRPAWEALLTRR